MSSKRLADTYSIANAFAKIGLNFLQIQSKNAEWFYKTSNCRWPVKHHSLSDIKLNSEIIIDESSIHKEPTIETQEHVQQSNKEVNEFLNILPYLIN